MRTLTVSCRFTIPDNTHPVDFILNQLPRRARALNKNHWRTTWPPLLTVLREIDAATHPDDNLQDREPEPPPTQALDEFLTAQDSASET